MNSFKNLQNSEVKDSSTDYIAIDTQPIFDKTGKQLVHQTNKMPVWPYNDIEIEKKLRKVGQVYQGSNKINDKFTAIKKFDIDIKYQAEFIKQLNFIYNIDHTSFIEYKGYAIQQQQDIGICNVYLAMELCDFSLQHYIHRYKLDSHLPLKEVIQMIIDIASGLKLLHDNGFTHGNIKPTNFVTIMDNKNRKIRMTDFIIQTNQNKQFEYYTNIKESTIIYTAPEQVDQKQKTQQNDTWGLGLLIFEIFTQTQPYYHQIKDTDNIQDVQRIVKNYTPGDIFFPNWEKMIPNKEIVNLIKKCCQYNRQQGTNQNRPSMDEIIRYMENEVAQEELKKNQAWNKQFLDRHLFDLQERIQDNCNKGCEYEKSDFKIQALVKRNDRFFTRLFLKGQQIVENDPKFEQECRSLLLILGAGILLLLIGLVGAYMVYSNRESFSTTLRYLLYGLVIAYIGGIVSIFFKLIYKYFICEKCLQVLIHTHDFLEYLKEESENIYKLDENEAIITNFKQDLEQKIKKLY
ncbi:Protein kinase-like domain [Pseudocohnilembus persalinus]|uniref:Protein kinase-like domain n=1 Tax=Pseudocohnilembus persalinus TaxID=266149 RepID=A0A0V0QJW9_PSEPJ|nr:Protein kinase-like domain [Pseudocohnilembus persalinus]|eukprot:KRX02424.1 Protein kinase-like domain [Pseudocohnilembus persalinus]